MFISISVSLYAPPPHTITFLSKTLVLPVVAVNSIKRQHLVEVRAMTNPPAAVKLALESICLMLGEETGDWKKIRQVIIRENFISSIVSFSSEEMRYRC